MAGGICSTVFVPPRRSQARESTAPVDRRIRETRAALDREGFVVLEAFADPARIAAYRTEFDRDSHKMTRSGVSIFALKYGDIEHHRIVADLRSDEMLDFVNGVAVVGRRLLPEPLGMKDVQVGYSIPSGSADLVGYHFDQLNFLNAIVPILMPSTPPISGRTPTPWAGQARPGGLGRAARRAPADADALAITLSCGALPLHPR